MNKKRRVNRIGLKVRFWFRKWERKWNELNEYWTWIQYIFFFFFLVIITLQVKVLDFHPRMTPKVEVWRYLFEPFRSRLLWRTFSCTVHYWSFGGKGKSGVNYFLRLFLDFRIRIRIRYDSVFIFLCSSQ